MSRMEEFNYGLISAKSQQEWLSALSSRDEAILSQDVSKITWEDLLHDWSQLIIECDDSFFIQKIDREAPCGMDACYFACFNGEYTKTQAGLRNAAYALANGPQEPSWRASFWIQAVFRNMSSSRHGHAHQDYRFKWRCSSIDRIIELAETIERHRWHYACTHVLPVWIEPPDGLVMSSHDFMNYVSICRSSVWASHRVISMREYDLMNHPEDIERINKASENMFSGIP